MISRHCLTKFTYAKVDHFNRMMFLCLPVGVKAEKAKPLRPALKQATASCRVMEGKGVFPFLIASSSKVETRFFTSFKFILDLLPRKFTSVLTKCFIGEI